MKGLNIIYRDELGIVRVTVDSESIMFIDNVAYFDSMGEEYAIRTKDIVSIEKEFD